MKCLYGNVLKALNVSIMVREKPLLCLCLSLKPAVSASILYIHPGARLNFTLSRLPLRP